MKIGFIGCGNMAQTIIRGMIREDAHLAKRIAVSNRTVEKAENFARETGVIALSSNMEVVRRSDVIFLAVKPFVLHAVLDEIRDYVREEQILISMAAGVSIAEIEEKIAKSVSIIRIMPNVCCGVGEGMVLLSRNADVCDKKLHIVEEILGSASLVDHIDEELMDAATLISGSSPAFLALFAEAIADGSVLAGVPREKAYRYIAKALVGTGTMMLENGMHPGEIKDMVSSPKGVTISGVKHLEKSAFRYMLMDMVSEVLNK